MNTIGTFRLAIVASAVGLTLTWGGCTFSGGGPPGLPNLNGGGTGGDVNNDNSGGGDNDNSGGGGPDGNGGGIDLCGARTATSVPGAGPLTATTSLNSLGRPADSALARALVFAGVPRNGCEGFGGGVPPIEYELGDGGVVLRVNGVPPGGPERFAIAAGCLTVVADAMGNEGGDPPSDLGDDPFGVFQPDPGPCGDGAFPLGPGGIGDIASGFICVSIESSEFCVDCDESSGAWTQTGTSTTRYRALGSIPSVTVLDPCTGEVSQVAIQTGDEVTVMFLFDVRYE